MKQPCLRDCPDRWAECHATCEKWLEYEAERNKQYEERAEIVRQAYEVNKIIKDGRRRRNTRKRNKIK